MFDILLYGLDVEGSKLELLDIGIRCVPVYEDFNLQQYQIKRSELLRKEQ